MSKIIYAPKGAAAEYSKYAANFYVGCLGDKGCSYCYCPRVLRGYWPDTPTLKKCLVHPSQALMIFEKEVEPLMPELRKHGLFFNFVSDPFLPETIGLNTFAMRYCILHSIPVIALTKQTWWVKIFLSLGCYAGVEKDMAFGFTLTGHDELEPGCATNAERIEAMKQLHDAGFRTWASIEPIIDFDSSFRMIKQTLGFCDLFKVGLKSGSRYDRAKSYSLIAEMAVLIALKAKIYFKDSLLKQAGIDRKDLPSNCVDADYNMFAE